MLEKERDHLIDIHKDHLGLVAVDVPLISNLSVCDNIALIIQYHQNVPAKQAVQLVISYLKRFGMEKIAYKRNPSLTDEERFCAMILRAAMVTDATILIDRPLKILPDLEEKSFFYNILGGLADIFHECHILDYEWNRERYEMIYEIE